jgi:SAM-dependent methyltransferase
MKHRRSSLISARCGGTLRARHRPTTKWRCCSAKSAVACSSGSITYASNRNGCSISVAAPVPASPPCTNVTPAPAHRRRSQRADAACGPAQHSRLRWLLPFLRGNRPPLLAADASALPLPAQSIGLLWSNLMLHWLDDPLPAFREANRLLEVGGLLMFSTFGPDTLKELRAASAMATRIRSASPTCMIMATCWSNVALPIR